MDFYRLTDDVMNGNFPRSGCPRERTRHRIHRLICVDKRMCSDWSYRWGMGHQSSMRSESNKFDGQMRSSFRMWKTMWGIHWISKGYQSDKLFSTHVNRFGFLVGIWAFVRVCVGVWIECLCLRMCELRTRNQFTCSLLRTMYLWNSFRFIDAKFSSSSELELSIQDHDVN